MATTYTHFVLCPAERRHPVIYCESETEAAITAERLARDNRGVSYQVGQLIATVFAPLPRVEWSSTQQPMRDIGSGVQSSEPSPMNGRASDELDNVGTNGVADHLAKGLAKGRTLV